MELATGIANTLTILLNNYVNLDSKVREKLIEYIWVKRVLLLINLFAVEYNQEAKRKRMNDIPEVPSVESWMQKYNEQNNKESGKVIHTFWSYPDHMEHRTDLPPSLLKFRPEHFYDDHFEEWGN